MRYYNIDYNLLPMSAQVALNITRMVQIFSSFKTTDDNWILTDWSSPNPKKGWTHE